MKSMDTTTDAEHQAGGEYSHGRSEATRSLRTPSTTPCAAARDIVVDQLSAHDLKSAAARTIVYADSAAVSITWCTAQDVVKEDISTAIRVFEPGNKAESALENLIAEYTAALRKASPCEVKSG
ncbi:hypothetical protein ACFVZD_19120 [Streptomyces sp. NPDC058287]|uniref:hypothetical protein n=1 Tax=unclassified Streptomyces TaxID=2593676 RepID=UPI0036EEFB75